MEIVVKYFKELTETQRHQIAMLGSLYREWNARINVVSRKDIDNLYEHHVLHSLAVAKAFRFSAGTRLLDFGTGGGFPGIPLAIVFPECHFTLIDGTGKKILVAQAVSKAIGLKNCEAVHRRGEEERQKYDFVVSRAVMPLPDLVKIVRKNISPRQRNAMMNGVICLKGGDLKSELAPFGGRAEVSGISQWFDGAWFEEKSIVYLPL